MKKTFIYLFLSALALMLGGCGLFGADITDQESVNKCFPSKLEKHLDPQSAVFYLMIGTTSDFSFDMDVAAIKCLEPNAEAPANLNFSLLGNQEPHRSKADIFFAKKTAADGIKLNEIDFSHIAANVNKAVEMLKAEGYQADGVSMYDITFTGNPKEAKHHFLVRCKGSTDFGSNSRGAAALVTEYSEFTFLADADGNVTLNE
jgi:hypothetical protein